MVPRTTDRPPGLDLPDIYRWNFAQLPVMADDVAYIDEVLAALESQLCVDHNRVYATGASNGGPDVAGRPLRASSAALVGGGRRHLVLQAATFIAKRSAPSSGRSSFSITSRRGLALPAPSGVPGSAAQRGDGRSGGSEARGQEAYVGA